MDKYENFKKIMTCEQWEKLVSMLLEVIEGKDLDLRLKDISAERAKAEIERLEAEVERLNELLTPTK